jgi:membrane associated rhomboid family serine protease
MSFGPGPLSTAMKALIGANVLVFLVQAIAPRFGWYPDAVLGFVPAAVIGQLHVWQLATYMFLHGGVFHLLFNMLMLWMFGTELERMWGTRYFLKFYFVCGVGAAVLTLLFALMPLDVSRYLYGSIIIGASGAIFGLLIAYAVYFPDRPLLLFFLFPVKMKHAAMIFGAMELYAAMTSVGGVANATHLGGALVGYLYLKSGRVHPLAELKYRYLKWKINRVRKKFDVYSGGRANDWDRRVH